MLDFTSYNRNNIVAVLRHYVIRQFSKFKNSFPGHFWGAQTQADIIEFSNFLFQHKVQSFDSKTMCGFFIVFILKGTLTF